MLLDIHSHRQPPYPEGIISADISDFNPVDGQLYSVGIHPWNTADVTADTLERLARASEMPCVVAIGECGIDTLRGAPLFRQMNVFRRHIELSEQLHKPLIIHDVKAHDIIVGLRRDMKPQQPWIIHGFRGKPTVAKMMLDCGCSLSFGEKFNPETVKEVPADRMFAETDESSLPIEDIIHALSDARGEDLLPILAANTSSLF